MDNPDLWPYKFYIQLVYNDQLEDLFKLCDNLHDWKYHYSNAGYDNIRGQYFIKHVYFCFNTQEDAVWFKLAYNAESLT